jgi:hypothetical protein
MDNNRSTPRVCLYMPWRFGNHIRTHTNHVIGNISPLAFVVSSLSYVHDHQQDSKFLLLPVFLSAMRLKLPDSHQPCSSGPEWIFILTFCSDIIETCPVSNVCFTGDTSITNLLR